MKSFSIYTFHLDPIEAVSGIGRHSALEFNDYYFSFPDKLSSKELSYTKYGKSVSEVVLPTTYYLENQGRNILFKILTDEKKELGFSQLRNNCSDMVNYFLREAKYSAEPLQTVGYPLKLEKLAKEIGLAIINNLFKEGNAATKSLTYQDLNENILAANENLLKIPAVKLEVDKKGLKEDSRDTRLENTKLIRTAYFKVLQDTATKHYTQNLDEKESKEIIKLYQGLLHVSPVKSYFDITDPEYNIYWTRKEGFSKLLSASYEVLATTVKAIAFVIVSTITFTAATAATVSAFLITVAGLIPATLALAFVPTKDPNDTNKIVTSASDGFFKKCSNAYKNLSPWKKRALCITVVLLLIALGVVTGGVIYAPIAGVGIAAALTTILTTMGTGIAGLFGAAVSAASASLITAGTAMLLGIWSGLGVYKFTILPKKDTLITSPHRKALYYPDKESETESQNSPPSSNSNASIKDTLKKKNENPASRSNSRSFATQDDLYETDTEEQRPNPDEVDYRTEEDHKPSGPEKIIQSEAQPLLNGHFRTPV